MDVFDEWQRAGTTFTWASTTPANGGRAVDVFTRRCGTPGAPPLVCVHGFPTASIDFRALADELAADVEIHTLDFPGYGLSDKPRAPYVYSLYDDARLLLHAITEVWQLGEYRMITHDRGSSVGMITLAMLADLADAALPRELFLTNANIYLPLANLTAFQVALLDDATGRATAAATTPQMLAAGLGAATFLPRRDLQDPEIAALARCFAHNDGIAVLPDTVRYLHERAADETGWLQRLSGIGVDTTLIWGLHDSVAPLRVANHVWQTYLRSKPGRNRYWVVPGADHYLQCDAPAELAQIIRLTMADGPVDLQTIGDRPDGAVLVDQSGGDDR
ncbi:MAG: alpha/beta hydrolase [Mycolicibacterium rufum]|uniref:Fluoroacetate dehalogenase n=1 Tax=Mycolicibacterium chlorophenolicum TaxID=37916 RepID=A0A0J6WPN1_9MYCO|nr:alpha/beta fold hydrolase [Mycolicibacterium chlorophenolicum]KMO84053.1 Fluoroacetate dehalogenase [Mycolicibacterium chlorophenolicum]MBI5339082.1 alpha/beta hydrolase [Mycolicibacterium rufum]